MSCPGHLANMWPKLEFRLTQSKYLTAKSLSLSHSRGPQLCLRPSRAPRSELTAARSLPRGPTPANLCVHTYMLTRVGAEGLPLKALIQRRKEMAPDLPCPPLCLPSCPRSPPEPQPPRAPPPQHLHNQWYKPSFLRNHWPGDQRELGLEVHQPRSSRPLNVRSETLTSILYVTRMSLTIKLSLN